VFVIDFNCINNSESKFLFLAFKSIPFTIFNRQHILNEASAQIADAITEEKPQIYETSRHIEVSVDDMWLVSDDIGIDRSRYRDTHTPSRKNDIDKASRNSWEWIHVFLAHSRLFCQYLLE
jgi:hypothetical protein